MDKIEIFRAEGVEDYYEQDLYIAECYDEHTFDKVDVGGVKIQLAVKYQKNGLHKNPVRAMIVKAMLESQFNKGDELICKYSTFIDPTYHTKNVELTVDGKELYLIKNRDIICKVEEGGNIIPRKGMLICEPVEGNLIDTTLFLNRELQGRRRDLVKVVKAFEGSKAKEGEYLITMLGGDYEFYNEGKLYIAVDEYYEDYFAIVQDSKWFDATRVRIEMDLHNSIKF